MPPASSAAFEPGPGVAIVSPASLVLVEQRADVDVDALVASLTAADPLDTLLGVLTRGGVRTAPSFVIVLHDHGASTVLVRGPGAVLATRADGTSCPIDAQGAATWAEAALASAVSFSAWVTGERTVPCTWRVDTGVLPAVSVHGWTPHGTATDRRSVDAAAPAPAPAPATEVPGREVARPADAVAPASETDFDFDFAHLLNHTLFFEAEAAAVRPGRAEAEPGVAGPAPASPAVPIDPNATLLPFADGPLGPDADAPPRALRAPAVPPVMGAPTVRAVRCAAGHLNPPEAARCRSCDRPIETRSVVVVPRPSLGRLRFDTGQVVELTRPLLIGRKPPTGEVVNGEPAGAVALPDPEHMLSRLHLEVQLDGWRVLVVDRRSVNLSHVRAPNAPPVQLDADVPYPIVPGAEVNLGGHVSFTYELDRA